MATNLKDFIKGYESVEFQFRGSHNHNFVEGAERKMTKDFIKAIADKKAKDIVEIAKFISERFTKL